MIDWTQGYECNWSITQRDRDTWFDTRVSLLVKTASISHDATDDVPLLETASLTVDGPVMDPGWYTLKMQAVQGGTSSRESLGTFWMEPKSVTYYGGSSISTSVDGYSVLYPCSDKKCKLGDYAPKGSGGEKTVADFIRPYTPAPVKIAQGYTFALKDFYVFDPDISYIKAVWTMLDAVDWCIQVDGDGTINILPKPNVAKITMDRSVYGQIQPTFDKDYDISALKNVYRVVYGDKEYEVVNDDPNSPISTVSRGFRSEEVDTSPQLLEGETIETYAKRRLVEMNSVLEKWSYTREYIPGLYVFDMWDCRRNDVGLTGNGRILTQKLTCDKGVVVEEKIGIEVHEYGTNYVDLTNS